MFVYGIESIQIIKASWTQKSYVQTYKGYKAIVHKTKRYIRLIYAYKIKTMSKPFIICLN